MSVDRRAAGALLLVAWSGLGALPLAASVPEPTPQQIKADNDNRTAQALLERQLVRARQADDAAAISDVLGQLALVQLELGEFDRGRQLALESLDQARRSGDPLREATALGAVGDAHFYSSEYEDALARYRAAYDLMRAHGDRFGAAVELKSIGITQGIVGRDEEAIAALEAASRTFREMRQPVDAASALENLGAAYLRLGADVPAFAALTEALSFARASGDERAVLHALVRLADLYLGTGFPGRALEPLGQALDIAERREMPHQHVWALMSLVQAQFQLGRLDEAIENQELVLVRCKAMSEEYYALALWKMAQLLRERDPARAVESLERARSILRELNLPAAWQIDAGLGEAHRRLGDLDLAIELHERAVAGLESRRASIVSDSYRASYFDKHESAYGNLLEALWERHETDPRPGDVERAFSTLERSRARSLLEAIGDSRPDGDGPLDHDLAERAREIEDRMTRLQRYLVERGVPRATRGDLLQQLDRAESDLESLIAEVRRRNPRYAALRYPEPLGLEAARELLGPRTAFVSYFDSGRHVFAFLLTADAAEVRRIEVSPELLAQRVRAYVELIASDEGAGWSDVSRRLYAELIAPLGEDRLQGITDLIVSPDGVLSFLPFETLLDDRGYLIERCSVSYTPSATVLRALRSEPRRESMADLLMFANPTPPDYVGTSGAAAAERTRALYESEGLEVPPIPYSAAEADAVRGLARHLSEIYVGAEASERRVKQWPLERFRIVHFATHGLISPQRPARSALLLAPGDPDEDGFLQVREIVRLRLASDLVVLSACRTARGRVLAGDGVQGLSQAFLHAGARAVLASLWDVNDDRTALLMKRFYEQLNRGHSEAEALRQAKLAMLRDETSAAPRFWAPFILTGSAAETLRLTGAPWWRARAPWLLLPLAVAAGWLLFRRFQPGSR